MKVLIASSWYPPILSGSSLWAESLAKALQKRGNEVQVLTTGWKGMPEEDSLQRSEVVHRLPAFILPRSRLLMGLSIAPIAYSPANCKRALQIVRQFKPDVIHQINHIFDTLFLSAYAATKTKTALVGSITTPIQSSSPLISFLMRSFDRLVVYRFGVSHWQRIICSDSTHARYTLDAYGDKAAKRIVRDIFVGVHQRIQGGQVVARANYPLIVTIGHVHPMRDPTNLIRAMPTVLLKFPHAKLIIAGRVQFQRPVEETQRLGLGEVVEFIGEVPAEQVPELVSRAQVFAILHFMQYAGLSFTALEAMQFGTPVLINSPDDVYGEGVIQDGENIMLVNRDDPSEIARKLIQLLGDESMRNRIGENGKTFIKSYISWDLNAEKSEKLYRQLQTELSA